MKIIYALFLGGIMLITTGRHSIADIQEVPFAPPEGKVLLIIGQDKGSIDDYVHSIGIVPGGTMLYTSIQDADGLETTANHGGGIHHGQYLLDQYPDSVLQIGLWLVGALEDTIEGKYDQNIDKLGDWISKAQRPVFLRIGYEFDFKANHYEPKAYSRAFRYIVSRLRNAKVKNAAFVWHSYGNLSEHPWDEWYPGDDYVDWFAISIFNKPNIYMKKFAELARQHHKGLMIAESTPQGIGTSHGEASWQNWFVPFIKFINDEKVQIVSYINYNWEEFPMFKGQGWGDARVQANRIIQDQWRQEISKDKYLNSSAGLFKLLGAYPVLSDKNRKR